MRLRAAAVSRHHLRHAVCCLLITQRPAFCVPVCFGFGAVFERCLRGVEEKVIVSCGSTVYLGVRNS